MQTVTLINAFEVPPEADEAFIGAWEQARPSALLRALRTDVALRFVDIARVDAAKAGQEAVGDPDSPGSVLAHTQHAGVYEVVREDGEAEGAGGVVLITFFEVAADDDERFLTGWHRVREALEARRGYLGTRLHRSLGPADFRFVSVTRWSSPLMVARALQEADVAHATAATQWHGRPALYLPVSR